MPELPEVETVRRGLLPAMQEARFERVIVRRGDLRWPLQRDFVGRLEGKTVRLLGRRAKYLLAYLSSGDVLIMHLGMSGSFRVSTASPLEPGLHDHVVFQMGSGTAIAYNDPRRFGFMKIVRAEEIETEPLLSGLGPEPLDPIFDAAVLAAACAGKTASVKSALLDQRVVAGLGNIYVCESLHRAGISPRRRAASLGTKSGLPTDRTHRLIEAIKAVLEEAIQQGGSTLRDHRRADGELGAFQHQFRVYDRVGENCSLSRCGGTIRRIVQTGRSTFFCPACQR